MQRREAGVGPAALELHKQCFLGRAGEVARAFERAVGATGTLFLLKEVKTPVTLMQLTFKADRETDQNQKF